MLYVNPLLLKTFSPVWIIRLFKKTLNCRGYLGLWRVSLSKARTNKVEKTPGTNKILLDSGHLQHERKSQIRHCDKNMWKV